MNRYGWSLLVMIAALALAGGFATRNRAEPAMRAIEVGAVAWGRDLEAALAESGRTGRPVFAFFQEVPGCIGCRKFGAEVMSDPVIVGAVEGEFVPVLIYNNRPGKDADLLRQYGEPAWNYQVVRFLDAAGKDLIPRQDRVWTLDALARRMVRALEAAGRAAPKYLEVAAYENDTAHHAMAAFAQPCFWSGEYELGRIPGVISTEAGWLGGREVTLVRYHTDLITLDRLIDRAVAARSADRVFLPEDGDRERARRAGRLAVGALDDSYRRAGEADQKRQIRATALGRMGLSAMQLTKVNSLFPVDPERALAWLTPRQRQELERLR